MLTDKASIEKGIRFWSVGILGGLLVMLGAREDQVESVSLGEEKPKNEGTNEAAWAQNRRGDMLYNGEF